MKVNEFLLFFISTVLFLTSIIVYIIDREKTYTIFIMMAIALFMMMQIMAIRLLARNRLPSAYNIAVIGFPKAGKTSIITALFGELFAGSIAGIDVVPRGEKTIQRINDDLSKLELGKILGPTTDQDLFAYRADITYGEGIFRKKFKVQIGDFPGDDSQKYSEEYGQWLHKTQFFKWVMEADAFIFVIDLAPYLESFSKKIEYVSRMTKAIRAAWQHLQEYHIDGKKSLKEKRVVLLFSKSDLLFSYIKLIYEFDEDENVLREEIISLGFGEELPSSFEMHDLPEDAISALKMDFKELSDYLSRQGKLFKILNVSIVGKTDFGRFGIRELIKFIMPR